MVLLDVLQYLDPSAQSDVLHRIRAALPDGGLLLLRVGDADAGLRFLYTRWVDCLVMRLRGHAGVTAHWRSLAQWRAMLCDCGFDTSALPMSHGTPFANVLIVARAMAAAGPRGACAPRRISAL